MNKTYSLILTLFISFLTHSGFAQLDVQIKLGDRNACTNSTLLFLDSIVSGTPLSREWISSVATFSSTSSAITEANFSASGNVVLKTQDATNTFYDTVYVTLNTPPVVSVGGDQSVCCDNGDISLNLSIVSPLGGVWSCPQNPGVVSRNVFSSDEACNLIVPPATSIQNELVYIYTDPSTQCSNADTLSINVNSLPVIVTRDVAYCQDLELINLSSNSSDLVLSPANVSLGTSVWRCLDSNSTDNNFTTDMLENRGTALIPEWWLNFGEDVYTVQNAGKDTIVLEFSYTNQLGCSNKDTVNLIVVKVPKLIFSRNRELCWDEGDVSLNQLVDVNFPDATWSVYDSTGFGTSAELGTIRGDTINTMNSLTTGGTYIIRCVSNTQVSTGCPAYNDTLLTINPLPTISLNALSSRICEDAGAIDLLASPAGGVWSSSDPSSLSGGNSFDPTAASSTGQEITFYYNYTDPATACTNIDSIKTTIDAAPTLDIQGEDSLCYTNAGQTVLQTYNLTTTNSSNTVWLVTDYYDNRQRFSLSVLTDSVGVATFRPIDRDTFRIGVVAQGLGSCDDIVQAFDVILYQDSTCLLSVPEKLETSISIYPNPSLGIFTIENLDAYEVSIYDMLGKSVDFERGENEQIYLAHKGLFIIEFVDEKAGIRVTKKLVVR